MSCQMQETLKKRWWPIERKNELPITESSVKIPIFCGPYNAVQISVKVTSTGWSKNAKLIFENNGIL